MMNLSPDSKFKITVGAASATILAAAGFGWKAQATLSQINESLKSTVQRLDSVETKLTERINSFEILMSDRFTKTAAAEWSLRLQVVNPGLKIPDPRDPSRLLGWTDGLREWPIRPQNLALDWRKP
jgi:hypothetical protein